MSNPCAQRECCRLRKDVGVILRMLHEANLQRDEALAEIADLREKSIRECRALELYGVHDHPPCSCGFTV